MADITNVFDAVIQFPTYLLVCILYFLVCALDLLLSVIDLVYSPIAVIFNIFLSFLNFLPNVIITYFSWLFDLSPMFEVFVTVSIYILYIIIVLRLVKLVWDLLPVA